MEGDVGNLEGGEKAEDDSGENGNEQGETEGGGVEVDIGEKRNADGIEVSEQPGAGESEQQSENSTEKGENEALREHLANEAALAGTESGADGDFLLARGGT